MNIPAKTQKTLSMIRMWSCVLLVAIALVLSFMPMVSLTVKGERVGTFLDLAKEMGLDLDKEEIPETIDVSAIDLIGCITYIYDLVAGEEESKDLDDYDLEDLANMSEEELEELYAAMNGESMEDEEDEKPADDAERTTKLVAIAIASTVMDSAGSDDEEGSSGFLGIIFEIILTFGCLIAVLGMIIALPIIALYRMIRALITACTNTQTPDKSIAKMGPRIFPFITFILTLMVLQTMLPGMSYASGAMGILIVAIVAAVVNMVFSRLRTYKKSEAMYLNFAQGASVLGIVGFAMFFLNMVKSNIFSNFVNSDFIDYIVAVGLRPDNAEPVSASYWVDGIGVLMMWGLLISTVSYLVSCATRFACMHKGGDVMLVGSIFAVVISGFGIFLSNACHRYNLNDLDAEPTSFLANMTEDEKSALIIALVGALIMVAAEVAFMILKKKVCKDVSEETAEMLLSGQIEDDGILAEISTADAAPVAAAEAPVAEAAPAAAEEAPAAEESVPASADTAEEPKEN